jgi:outer membrane protein TolC
MGNNTTIASTTNPTSTRITQIDQSAADSFGDVGRIGVKVDVPLFEGGRIAARVRDERAKLRTAEQRLRKLELQIRLDVETGTLNATSAQERIQVTEKSIAAGKESLRIEREKYDVGRGTITDVLDVQSALLEAQTSYYRALADYDIALAQLRLAMGEDFTQTGKPNTGNLP